MAVQDDMTKEEQRYMLDLLFMKCDDVWQLGWVTCGFIPCRVREFKSPEHLVCHFLMMHPDSVFEMLVR